MAVPFFHYLGTSLIKVEQNCYLVELQQKKQDIISFTLSNSNREILVTGVEPFVETYNRLKFRLLVTNLLLVSHSII